MGVSLAGIGLATCVAGFDSGWQEITQEEIHASPAYGLLSVPGESGLGFQWNSFGMCLGMYIQCKHIIH